MEDQCYRIKTFGQLKEIGGEDLIRRLDLFRLCFKLANTCFGNNACLRTYLYYTENVAIGRRGKRYAAGQVCIG